MKKYSTTLIAFMAAASVLLCSCKSEVAQPVKVADYLFEVTVDDYSAEAPNDLVDIATTEFNCSAVRNGNYYGRNLDFFISEISEVVVRTPAKEGRHAVIGVSRLMHMTDAEIEAGVSADQLAILPWGMFDGINDAGLFCNMNVTPAGDSGIPHTSPNPGMPQINCMFLLRALLDNCASVEEAIDFVNSHDVIGMDKGGFDLHFMIGDPHRNVILEYVDNKAVFVDGNIMTNFLVSELPVYTPHADGMERYDILSENYAEGCTMEGMWNLLRRVRFSQAYDPETKPFWKSEFVGEPYNINTPLEEILANPQVQADIANFKNFKETGYYTPEMHLWYTLHNSTYDIENKTLWVTIHEDYEHRYEFKLDE